MKHEFADINGLRMHYVTHGEGAPVLLLHGFPEYWGVWRQVMERLGRDFRVIAPDLRGYNLTSRPEGVEAYHIKHLVEDVRALVEHLGLGPVTLVAQDWGALLGWSFLLRHPGLVRRYVTLDVTHPALFERDLRENPAQQKASEYMLLFRTPQVAEAMVAANDYAFARQTILEDARRHGAELSDEDWAEWLDTLKQPGAFTAGFNYYRAARIGPPDGRGSPGGSNLLEGLTPEQLQVKVPVLVLWGEQDPYLLPSGLEGLEQYVPDVTVHRLPDASHWVSVERPDVVAQQVRDFVARGG